MAVGANPQTGMIGPHPSVYFVMFDRTPYLKGAKGLYGSMASYNKMDGKDLDYRMKSMPEKNYEKSLDSLSKGCYGCRLQAHNGYSSLARKY